MPITTDKNTSSKSKHSLADKQSMQARNFLVFSGIRHLPRLLCGEEVLLFRSLFLTGVHVSPCIPPLLQEYHYQLQLGGSIPWWNLAQLRVVWKGGTSAIRDPGFPCFLVSWFYILGFSPALVLTQFSHPFGGSFISILVAMFLLQGFLNFHLEGKIFQYLCKALDRCTVPGIVQ